AVRLGMALGVEPTIQMRWGEILAFADSGAGQRYAVLSAEPTNVDMRKVSATIRLVDRVISNDIAPEEIRSSLTTIEMLPSTSMVRFAAFAALGAAALGVVFGVSHLMVLVLIAFIAGAGAVLRRRLAKLTSNFFAQPLAAAGLAGLAGAAAMRMGMAPPDAMV